MALCTTGSVNIAIDPNEVEVADATGFSIGDTISFANAVGEGMDLITTIANISGTTITLVGSASATVENEQFCLLTGGGGWFGPDGDCDCGCGVDTCLVCDMDTPGSEISISISGGSPGDCTGCDTRRRGTFVLTNPAAPEYGVSAAFCQWGRPLQGYNCSFDEPFDTNSAYLGAHISVFGGLGFGGITLRITGSVGSGFLVDVWLIAHYFDQDTAVNTSSVTSYFSATVASCADLVGLAVPHVSTTVYEHYVTAGPGDYCDFEGATVTILG